MPEPTPTSTAPPAPWLPHAAPFAAYMGFIALEQLLEAAAGVVPELETIATGDHLWLYPLKILVVIGLLWGFRRHYVELIRPLRPLRDWPLAVAVGAAVFLLWINMDWPFATQGRAEGYNPHAAGLSAGLTAALIGVRLFGAAVVVPVFEELFWRSFLMRYLVHRDFTRVPMGTLTPVAFGATCLLFGLEHHLWLAGMMAGAAYAGLLAVTRNLPTVILAHGVTNLMLGLWVLNTGQWRFW